MSQGIHQAGQATQKPNPVVTGAVKTDAKSEGQKEKQHRTRVKIQDKASATEFIQKLEKFAAEGLSKSECAEKMGFEVVATFNQVCMQASMKSRLPLPEMAERAVGDSFSNEVKTGKSGDSYFLRLGVGFMDKLNLKGDGYVLDVVMGEKDGKPTMTLIPSSKPREQRAPKGSKKNVAKVA